MIPPVRARELIEAGARRALGDLSTVAPYDPGRPCEIRVEFKNTRDPAKLADAPGRRACRSAHGRLARRTTGGRPGGSSSFRERPSRYTMSSSSTSVRNAFANGLPFVRSRTSSQSICSRTARAISSTLAKSGSCSESADASSRARPRDERRGRRRARNSVCSARSIHSSRHRPAGRVEDEVDEDVVDPRLQQPVLGRVARFGSRPRRAPRAPGRRPRG